MEIHPIQTGSVNVKTAQKSRQSGGMLGVLTDDEWSGWLPIYAWLIRHPEGTIVVDTGETARTAEPGYFPSWHPYYRYAVKMNVSREQEIDRQLARLGVDAAEVDTVILTHFHTDHAGGLYHFPNSTILVSKSDYAEARGLLGKIRGYLPQHWTDWFNPKEIPFKKARFGTFNRYYPVTADGSIVIVPTPGHTHGHISVVADTGSEKIFLAGDTSYSQQLLTDMQPDGVSPDAALSIETHKRILRMAESDPLVYLPSHDPESAERLINRGYLDRYSAAVSADPVAV